MSAEPDNRRLSARLAPPHPTEFYFEQSTVKNEPDFATEIIGLFDNVDDCYCRVCFKIFTLSDVRTELDMEFLSMLREVLQVGFKLTNGSQWICSDCNTKINSFCTFKNEVLDKQTKFAQMVVKNEHLDLYNIQELNENPIIDDLPDIYVKSEPEDELIECIVEEPEERKKSAIKRKKSRLLDDEKTSGKIKNPRTCQECGKKTFNLLNHKIRVHNYQHVFKCGQCTYGSTEKRKLQYHFQVVHQGRKKQRTCDQEQSQVCPHCAKQCRHLDEHIANIHLGERNFFCDLCPFSSYKRTPIEQHMMNIHLPKTVSCSLCDFVTINKDRLKKHIKNVHEVRDPGLLFPCNVPDCNKRFRNKFNLLCHVKRCHEGEVNYACEFPDCGKSFFTKTEQRIHFENSHCPKNVICDECGSTFSSVAMLRKHSSLHREYTKICTFPECGMKYRTATQLKNHVNRHHLGRKEYECKECSAAFYVGRDLERHIISKHMGVKFACQVPGCNSNLSRRDAYVNHLKHHTGISDDERRFYMKKLNEFCMNLNVNLKR